MYENKLDNTLMLGNGFIRSVYTDASPWESLYGKGTREYFHNMTFLYERNLLCNQQSDNQYKRILAEELSAHISKDKINFNVEGLEEFGIQLEKHRIREIITTNVDKGIERVLSEMNDYEEQWPEEIEKDFGEKIYSIRRNVCLKRENHTVRLWKIHGDTDNLASISLGFDQYCGSLAKIDGYLKGNYKFEKEKRCCVPIREKCVNNAFDDVSWIELFFKTNVYIAFFGMDFSEIDIWWLLDKRCRLIKQGVPIKNRVFFLYNIFDTGDASLENSIRENTEKKQIFYSKMEMLKAFGVECRKMDVGKRCINSIFENIV